jgi:hypothetical protein
MDSSSRYRIGLRRGTQSSAERFERQTADHEAVIEQCDIGETDRHQLRNRRGTEDAPRHRGRLLRSDHPAPALREQTPARITQGDPAADLRQDRGSDHCEAGWKK